MSLSPSTLELLTQAIPNLIGPAAAMPIPTTFPVSATQVTKFGFSGDFGDRRFSFSLDISADSSGAIPLQAILEGQVSWIGKNVAIDPPRDDGSVTLLRRSGLLLKVHPRAAIRRLTTETPDDPLQYPFPFWVLYEGVDPDQTLRDQMSLDYFATADFFDFDSSALPASAQPLLDDLSLELEANPNLNVLLTGYADAEGPAAHNLELGMERALAIQDYLTNKGIDPTRIQADTKGEESPKDRNPSTREAAGINRRVEIEFRSGETQVVNPGDALGTASEAVSITVFDPLGYFIDPLALILLLRPDLKNEPLAGFLDPLSPMITSHRVHVVSEHPDQDGTGEDNEYFSFHDSLSAALGSAGDNDSIVIDRPTLDDSVTVARPVSIIGKPDAAGSPPVVSNAIEVPIITCVSFANSQYGLRVLGLSFSNAQSDGGSVLNLQDLQNVYIAHCIFAGNIAISEGSGGAIKLVRCQRVLVASCKFRLNQAKRGGAIYAEDCGGFVVTGDEAPGLDDLLTSETDFQIDLPSLEGQFALTVPAVPPVLTGEGFSSAFIDNIGHGGGGAIGLVNSAFRIRNTFFRGNGATGTSAFIGYGGAVGVQVQSDSPSQVESHIRRCVALGNRANYGGAFGTAGRFDGDAALNGNPDSFAGGGRFEVSGNVIHQNSADQIGGGLHLVTGHHSVSNNRISSNTGSRNGGGLSIMSAAEAVLVQNIILFNLVKGDDANHQFMSLDIPPNGVGGGGAGIYTSFWVGPLASKVTLDRNRVIGNKSFENGGGLRASCGAQVTLQPGNLFKDNVAFLHGGAVSLNSAILNIEPGNQFEGNTTQDGREPQNQQRFRGGHGGAIYCYGGKVAASTYDDTRFGSCASDGTALNIAGSDSAPVLFTGNLSALQGGAIYIEREDAITNVVFRKVLGTLEHAIFEDNRATTLISNGTELFTGSTIAIFNLDNPAAFPVPLIVLRNLEIRLTQGIGLYLHASSALSQRSAINYVQLTGSNGILNEYIEQ